MKSQTEVLLRNLVNLWLFSDLVAALKQNEEIEKRFLAIWLEEIPERLEQRGISAGLDAKLIQEVAQTCSAGFSRLPLDLRTLMVEVSRQALAWTKPIRDAWEQQKKDLEIALHQKSMDSAISKEVFAHCAELPNIDGIWDFGKSLGPYSEKAFHRSRWGDWVHQYKYENHLVSEDVLQQIEESFAEAVMRFLLFELEEKFPKQAPFTHCVAIPPNNRDGISLPRGVCRALSENHSWLSDISGSLTRRKKVDSIKGKSRLEKLGITKGLYGLSPWSGMDAVRGILVIDDVFDTGSTMSSACEALKQVLPGVALYVVTLSHTNRNMVTK